MAPTSAALLRNVMNGPQSSSLRAPSEHERGPGVPSKRRQRTRIGLMHVTYTLAASRGGAFHPPERARDRSRRGDRDRMLRHPRQRTRRETRWRRPGNAGNRPYRPDSKTPASRPSSNRNVDLGDERPNGRTSFRARPDPPQRDPAVSCTGETRHSHRRTGTTARQTPGSGTPSRG